MHEFDGANESQVQFSSLRVAQQHAHNVMDRPETLDFTPVFKSYGIWKLLTQALMTFHKDIVG